MVQMGVLMHGRRGDCPCSSYVHYGLSVHRGHLHPLGWGALVHGAGGKWILKSRAVESALNGSQAQS